MNRWFLGALTVWTTLVLTLVLTTSQGQPAVLFLTMFLAAVSGGVVLLTEEMAGTH